MAVSVVIFVVYIIETLVDNRIFVKINAMAAIKT